MEFNRKNQLLKADAVKKYLYVTEQPRTLTITLSNIFMHFCCKALTKYGKTLRSLCRNKSQLIGWECSSAVASIFK